MQDKDSAKRTRILIILALLEGAVTIALGAFLLFPKPYVTSWGEEIGKRESYLHIDGQTLTQEDLEFIASIRTLDWLTLENCNVSECRLPELRFASRDLEYVDLSGTTGLWDLSFLSELPATDLVLSGCTSVDDVSALNIDKLDSLDISGTSVSDLTPLAKGNLHRLSFAHTNVEDLAPLSGMSSLWNVDGSYTKVSSLDVLADLDYLSCITFDGCPITAVSKSFSPYLSEISLSRTQVEDLSGFESCANLYSLDLSGNPQISSLPWLSKENYSSLTKVNLGGTGFDRAGLEWLRSCEGLEELTLDGIELQNLDLCGGMRDLSLLSAVACELTDISAIARCQNLETVLLGYNHLSSAKGLPMSPSEYPHMVVDLSHNELTTLTDLPVGGYRLLLLQGNELSSGTTVPAGIEAYEVAVSYFEGIGQSGLNDRNRFFDVYLLDSPASASEELEETFSAYRLFRIDEDELLYLLETDGLDFSVYEELSWYTSFVTSLRGGEAPEEPAAEQEAQLAS